MKRLAFLVSAAVLAGSASAQMKGMDMKDMDMKGMDMKGMDMKSEKKAGKAATHKAAGTVQKVDAAKGKVTIAHGPVQSLDWPAMTMTFTVKNEKLLDKIAVDKKVDFEFVKQGKDYVITSVK